MTYNEKEVMAIVRECLGENATGLYIDYARLQYTKLYNPAIYVNEQFDETVHETATATFAAGCTKVVIIPEGKDYVIKLPIAGAYITNMMDGSISVKDECGGDVFACEERVLGETGYYCQKMILCNVYVGTYNGIPVYVQPQVAGPAESIVKPVREEVAAELAEIFGSETRVDGLTKNFAQEVLFYYGKEAVYDIISGMEYELYDMHEGNYGYMADGTPVIFDTAGFADVWYPDDDE